MNDTERLNWVQENQAEILKENGVWYTEDGNEFYPKFRILFRATLGSPMESVCDAIDEMSAMVEGKEHKENSEIQNLHNTIKEILIENDQLIKENKMLKFNLKRNALVEEIAAKLQNEKPYQIRLEVTHGKEGYQASLVWRNDRTVKVNDTYLASEFKQTIDKAQENLNQKIKNVS